MSGQAVEFHSALCVTDGRGREVSDIVTRCRFRVLPEQEIEAYLQREQPYDTAGSAKAEGLGIALMESMTSDDPPAIIGLTLLELCRLLRDFGLTPRSDERRGGNGVDSTCRYRGCRNNK